MGFQYMARKSKLDKYKPIILDKYKPIRLDKDIELEEDDTEDIVGIAKIGGPFPPLEDSAGYCSKYGKKKIRRYNKDKGIWEAYVDNTMINYDEDML